jgi:hypothetical protein
MSANGELFIGQLQDEALSLGLFDVDVDHIEVPVGYYNMWSDSDIPESDEIELGDGTFLSFTGYYEYDDEFSLYVITSVTRDNVTKQALNDKRAKGDWIHQLQPIVLDLLDGEPKLVADDVEWLMPILKAKIEYYNGLIGKAEYETILHNTER